MRPTVMEPKNRASSRRLRDAPQHDGLEDRQRNRAHHQRRDRARGMPLLHRASPMGTTPPPLANSGRRIRIPAEPQGVVEADVRGGEFQPAPGHGSRPRCPRPRSPTSTHLKWLSRVSSRAASARSRTLGKWPPAPRWPSRWRARTARPTSPARSRRTPHGQRDRRARHHVDDDVPPELEPLRIPVVSLTSGEATREVRVIDNGMPAATKPMNRGWTSTSRRRHDGEGDREYEATNRPRRLRNARAFARLRRPGPCRSRSSARSIAAGS